jgi:hypothetical protein
MKKIFVVAIVFATSCTYENVEPIPALKPAVPISYNKDIKPFMNSYCVSCHVAGGSGPGDDFTVYADVKTVATSGDLKNRVLDLKDMPPSGNPIPSDAELAKLKSWLDAGAPNN